MTPTPTTPKEQAIHLLADYATAQSALKAATAPYEAEAVKIAAAISKATAAEKARIEELEEQLKKLALNDPSIFGDGNRSMIEGGWKLALKVVEEVEMDAEEDHVCRIILSELKQVEKRLAKAESEEDHDAVRSLTFESIALTSLIVPAHRINKEYIKANSELHADWFEQFGLRVNERDSASLKPAPKPKTAKAKKVKLEPLQEAMA